MTQNTCNCRSRQRRQLHGLSFFTGKGVYTVFFPRRWRKTASFVSHSGREVALPVYDLNTFFREGSHNPEKQALSVTKF